MSKSKKRTAPKPAESNVVEEARTAPEFTPNNGPGQGPQHRHEKKQVDGIWVLLVFAALFLLLMMMGWWAS